MILNYIDVAFYSVVRYHVVMELTPLIVEDLKPALNWVVIDTPKKLSLLTDFAYKTEVLGFDCETNVAKKFHQRKTRTIQIGNKDEQYIVDLLAFGGDRAGLEQQGGYLAPAWASGLVEALSFVLCDPKKIKVGHNLQFDYETLYWNLGIRSEGFFDTLLAEMMLYAGIVPYYQKNFWGLDDVVGRYCKLKMSKEEQTSFDLETPLTENQIIYCALDTRLPLAVRNVQLKHLEARGCSLANSIENNAIMQFGDMHLGGMYLDAEEWNSNVEKTRLRHIQNVQTLDSHFLPVVGPHCPPAHDLDALERAWREENDTETRRERRKAYQEAKKEVTKYEKERLGYEGKAAINYGSPVQLLAALRKVGFSEQHLADTNDRSLERHGLFPVIKAVQAYRETDKVLKSYSDKFCTDYIDELTGRVHPKIKQLGADTGRTASVDPNMQNIIKKSNVGTEYEVTWRGCFKARPGYVLITSDYNGAELRILAEASQEPAFVDAFRKNWDVHSVGAEIIFGQIWKDAAEPSCAYYFTKDHQKCNCKKHKLLRDQIKAINFGIAYGMEAGKLADGLKITKAEAIKLLKTYRESFPKLIKYLESQGERAKNNLCSRTLSGRPRFYTKPTWDRALEICTTDLMKKKSTAKPSQKDVEWKMRSMWSSIEREGKNAPIQGTNADMAKVAAYYLWQQLFPKFGAFVVAFVHDEFVVECPEHLAEECMLFVEDCMIRGGEMFIKSIPVLVESHISKEWTK